MDNLSCRQLWPGAGLKIEGLPGLKYTPKNIFLQRELFKEQCASDSSMATKKREAGRKGGGAEDELKKDDRSYRSV